MMKNDEKIESAIEELFSEFEDVESIDEFIEEHEDEYSDDIRDFAFREAIRQGVTEYIEEHAEDFDLNDEGDCSSYLDETDDEEIQDLLMSYGADKSFDDYCGCKFAYETVNGTILAFDSDFQKEVFKEYLKTFNLDEKSIILMDSDKDAVERFDDDNSRYFEEDMHAIGVVIENGNIEFLNKADWKNNGDGAELYELIEKIGFECDFEGDSWKFETNGVYFIE